MGSAIAAQVRGAKTFDNSNNLMDGDYVYLIKKVLETKNRNGIPMFIAELRVIESTAATVSADLLDPGESNPLPVAPKNAEGALKVTFSNDSAGGNVKAFIKGVEGMSDADFIGDDEKDLFTPYYEEVVGEAQYFRGMLVRDITRRTRTEKGKNPGSIFVGHGWKPLAAENTAEKVAARRAKLDAEEKSKP